MKSLPTARVALRVTPGVSHSDVMHDSRNAPTQPPADADDAALEYARALSFDADADRTAAFWATLERTASAARHPVPERAPRRCSP
jgi:hypothetical protein